ncbi:sporulation integral membrane protein YtvI [Pseudoflavonifractor capillosus]|uniref:sporulation integral membrane protein YtvI n=1 Tax=Pseudoflavonifractor capillosus TaxID=106588 RepID=UPI00195A823B|nr:sporulation integral membrane protein YtvI [Pseudoflavonifractor capillosus]MBM6897355.1 sporulation integral membrane protein YtvI [Pseudoflavonifractor capillosus]
MEPIQLTWKQRGELWLRLGVRAVLLALALLALRYGVLPALSLLSPFVLALVFSWLLNPPVRWLQKKLTISRGPITMALLILVFGVVGGVLWALSWMAVEQVQTLFLNWEAIVDALLTNVDQVLEWFGGLEDLLPGGAYNAGERVVQLLENWVRDIDVSGWLKVVADRAPSLVGQVSTFVVATIVFLMATYFITADYPRLRFFITDRVPAPARSFCKDVRRIFMEAFGGYLKSQLSISFVVFVILALGFFAIGQPYGLLLALGFAVLDFIPIIGSGTVMVPWAVVDIIVGDYTHAVQLMVIWGIIALFRRLGEPKILGDQTGLSPILSLVGIYVGMLMGGVLGMIVGPLLLLVLINLGKLGIFSPVMGDLSLAASDVAAILKSGHKK